MVLQCSIQVTTDHSQHHQWKHLYLAVLIVYSKNYRSAVVWSDCFARNCPIVHALLLKSFNHTKGAESMFRRSKGDLHHLLHRPKPSNWQQFFASPLKYLARLLYSLKWRRPSPKKMSGTINVVCISDTHGTQPEVPQGDLLIHAGDLSQTGSLEEIQTTVDWLKTLSHPHKVIIAGNHDITFETEDKGRLDLGNMTYLQDSSTGVRFANGRALNIYGSPWTPTPGTWAFQHDRDEDVWTGRVPENTDILVTHRPPRFHLDVADFGDVNLLKELWRTRPILHVFGHVHEGYGTDYIAYDQFEAWYENIRRGAGSWVELLRMIGSLLRSLRRSKSASGTILVNAAVVGGLRDNERRKPLLVSL